MCRFEVIWNKIPQGCRFCMLRSTYKQRQFPKKVSEHLLNLPHLKVWKCNEMLLNQLVLKRYLKRKFESNINTRKRQVETVS